MSEELFRKLASSVIEGNEKNAVNFCKEAVEKDLTAKAILENGLMRGIREVGERFGKGEYFLPELLISGMAMQAAVAELEPILNADKEDFHVGKYLIGTVKGDIHDIGKNIVIMMLKSHGWKVTDLGTDVQPEKICSEIATGNYDIFGMSTLLTVTMPVAEETIQAISNAGLRDKIKIMVGGAPVTQEFADSIGADAYAKDAFDAVTKAQTLTGKAA